MGTFGSEEAAGTDPPGPVEGKGGAGDPNPALGKMYVRHAGLIDDVDHFDGAATRAQGQI